LDEIWNSVSQMWGLALADFGRNPHSSDSLRRITKFLGLATSGNHNSAMITDRRKFMAKWSLCGMS